MKDMTFQTLLAVFEEIFGRGLFWIMVIAAVLVTVGYVYVLIRDRSVSWHKFLWAQLSMPLGAIAAVWFVMAMTHSALSDIGGAIDVIVLCDSSKFNNARSKSDVVNAASDGEGPIANGSV